MYGFVFDDVLGNTTAEGFLVILCLEIDKVALVRYGTG